MLIQCPNCDTQFSVPDSAIGENGRKLKCAKCGHKWHFTPEIAHFEAEAESDSGFDVAHLAASLEANLGAQRDDFDRPRFEDSPSLSPKDFAMEDDAPPKPSPFTEAPQPIPDVFTKSREPRPKSGGGFVSFLVVILVILAGLGAAGWYFQDRVIAIVPEAGQVYQTLGLRPEIVGAGLIFRNYSSERPVQDGNEVLIVRGIIANTTDAQKEIPLLQLALFDKANTKLQQKVVKPPANSLDAGGTVGFRISLEQPNPEAVRFELTFTASEGK